MPKVLLLEDDRDMGMLLRTLLEIESYTVASYDPHIPAVQLTEQEMPDLILLDVHLGGQDGMQILKDIRCHPALKHIRIVMTSGINVSEECMKGGANAFIAKPYMPDRLLDLLKEVMEADSGQQISITPGANTTSEGRMAKFL